MSEIQAEYITDAVEMIGAGYEAQEITDASDLRKYRIELPNLYDDADLDPYEFRLLAHYKRVGVCTESTRTTATKCKMSTGQVSEKRQSLHDKKFIELNEVALKDGGFSYRIIVLDRWEENFKKYSTRSLSERPRSPHEHPVHSVKQRINHIKKEPKKEATPKANDFPSNVLFREVTEKYPKKANWFDVLKMMDGVERRLGRPPVKDDLFPYYSAWCANGWNEWAINWLEYAVKGELPKRNGKMEVVEKQPVLVY